MTNNSVCIYLWCHPVRGAVDRLEQISAAASTDVQAAETTGTAKVYELDDASGHQHDIVSFQVAMDHPVQVKVGHPL